MIVQICDWHSHSAAHTATTTQQLTLPQPLSSSRCHSYSATHTATATLQFTWSAPQGLLQKRVSAEAPSLHCFINFNLPPTDTDFALNPPSEAARWEDRPFTVYVWRLKGTDVNRLVVWGGEVVEDLE